MDYNVLHAELTDDPLSIGYAAMSDKEAAEALNALTQPAITPVRISSVIGIAYSRGFVVNLYAAQRSTQTPPELAAVVDAILKLMDYPESEIDLLQPNGTPDPANALMLGALLQAGIISQADLDAIMAFAIGATSRAAQLGLETVMYWDVARARSI